MKYGPEFSCVIRKIGHYFCIRKLILKVKGYTWFIFNLPFKLKLSEKGFKNKFSCLISVGKRGDQHIEISNKSETFQNLEKEEEKHIRTLGSKDGKV